MPACLNLIPIWLSFCVNRGITGWLWLKAGLSRHKEVGRRTFFLPQLPGRRFARWPRGANASAETSMPPAASFDDPASITFCVSRVIHELIKTFGMRLRGITVHVGGQHAHTTGGGHLLLWWQMGTRDCSRHESILKQGLAWACDAAHRREVH